MVQHHVSAAVKHLRGWITLVAVVVAVCATAQMLVYGFVNYTEVRFKEVKNTTPQHDKKRTVLNPNESAAAEKEEAVAGGVRSQAIERGKEVGPLRVKSDADAVMGSITDTTTSVGTFACAVLAVLTLLGVVIAGGANVPGVEKAVTAGSWSVILGLLSLPWTSAFPSLKIPGVFASYSLMTAAADGLPGAISSTAAFAQWIVMPLMAGVLALFVCGWYRVGVERGIIATSVNQFDAAIEKEMTTLAKRGVTAAGPRTMGVLNRAVGAQPAAVSPMAAPMKPLAPVTAPLSEEAMNIEQAVDEAAAMAASLARDAQSASSGGASNGRSVADAGYRRLI